MAKKEILDGFGVLKLGISVKEFENKFKQKINLKASNYIYKGFETEVYSINITPEITLDTVYIVFKNEKLISIGTDFNENLYNFLKERFSYKIHNDGYVHTIFETNSKDIICAWEGKYIAVLDFKEKNN